MDYAALGHRIRQQRKLRKLTQEALASAADVSTSYIGHIERGLKRCSLETLINLANVLDVTPDFLLQESLRSRSSDDSYGLSTQSLSMLNDIANVLREYEKK